MPAPGPRIVIAHQNVAPQFVERLVALLRAVFVDASLECLDRRQDEARLRPALADARSIVVVDSDWAGFEDSSEGIELRDPLGLYVPRPSSGEPPCHRGMNPSRFSAADPEQLEELIGQIAQRMQLPRAIELGAHRGKISELAGIAANLGRTATEVRLRKAAPLGFAVALLLVVWAGWKIRELTREPPPVERFGFESTATPWQCQQAAAPRGCVSVAQTQRFSRTGASSLELVVDLDPNDAKSAEIWANLGPSAKVNLEGRLVVAWVKPSSTVSGTAGRRTGFQLYVKDANWRSCYGAWVDASADAWQRLELRVGELNNGQFVESGFDGRGIAGVGIKVALPTPADARASGTVYVDSIGW